MGVLFFFVGNVCASNTCLVRFLSLSFQTHSIIMETVDKTILLVKHPTSFFKLIHFHDSCWYA